MRRKLAGHVALALSLLVLVVPSVALAAPGEDKVFDFGDNILDFLIRLGPYVLGLGIAGAAFMFVTQNERGLKAFGWAALGGFILIALRSVIAMVTGWAA